MLKNSEGIVFHSIKYGDSGRILNVYTKENGLMSFMIQGLNSRKNAKKTHFQHLNILDLHYYKKEKNNLQRLKDSNIITDNSSLDVDKLYIVIFAAEFLKNSILEEEANPPLYSFLKKWIENLHMEHKNPMLYLLNFCIEISGFLGFLPMNNEGKYFNLLDGCFENSIKDPSYTLSENSSSLFKKLLNKENRFSHSEQKETLDSIIRFYSCHLNNFKTPKSLEMLKAIWF